MPPIVRRIAPALLAAAIDQIGGKATWIDDGTFTNAPPGPQRFYRTSIRR